MRRLSSVARRYSRRTWLLWGIGVVALLAMSFPLVDPALLVFAWDVDVLALVVEGAVALWLTPARGAVRLAWSMAGDRGLRTTARLHLAVVRVLGP